MLKLDYWLRGRWGSHRYMELLLQRFRECPGFISLFLREFLISEHSLRKQATN